MRDKNREQGQFSPLLIDELPASGPPSILQVIRNHFRRRALQRTKRQQTRFGEIMLANSRQPVQPTPVTTPLEQWPTTAGDSRAAQRWHRALAVFASLMDDSRGSDHDPAPTHVKKLESPKFSTDGGKVSFDPPSVNSTIAEGWNTLGVGLGGGQAAEIQDSETET